MLLKTLEDVTQIATDAHPMPSDARSIPVDTPRMPSDALVFLCPGDAWRMPPGPGMPADAKAPSTWPYRLDDCAHGSSFEVGKHGSSLVIPDVGNSNNTIVTKMDCDAFEDDLPKIAKLPVGFSRSTVAGKAKEDS
jgi:hypothetical protein